MNLPCLTLECNFSIKTRNFVLVVWPDCIRRLYSKLEGHGQAMWQQEAHRIIWRRNAHEGGVGTKTRTKTYLNGINLPFRRDLNCAYC